MNILVTGANSFIGRALCKKMLADGYKVRGSGIRGRKSGRDRSQPPAHRGLRPGGRSEVGGKIKEERTWEREKGG